MPYVEIKNGKVVGCFGCEQYPGQQYVENDDPMIIAYQADQQKETGNAIIKANLANIDVASVRSMREYLCSLPDAPDHLKIHEAEAVKERAKLK